MPQLSLRALTLASLVVLTACSPLAPINFFIPDDSYHLQANQAYGSDERQRLDVYLPVGELEQAPVVLFFYGGSWRGGSKDNYTFVGEALAARGIITVVADYRVYPDVTYPEFLHDSADALAWVVEQRHEWQQQTGPLALLMAARPDRLVDPERNTQAMSEKLTAAGVPVSTHYFDARNHFTLVLALAQPFQHWDPVLDKTVDFIRQQAGTPAD